MLINIKWGGVFVDESYVFCLVAEFPNFIRRLWLIVNAVSHNFLL